MQWLVLPLAPGSMLQHMRKLGAALPDEDPVQMEAHGVIRITHVRPRRTLFVPDPTDFSSLRDLLSGADQDETPEEVAARLGVSW